MELAWLINYQLFLRFDNILTQAVQEMDRLASASTITRKIAMGVVWHGHAEETSAGDNPP
jgi:hypothetical protein